MPFNREFLKRIVDSKVFERTVLVAIALNAVTLGLETDAGVMEAYGGILKTIDRFFLVFFTIEIALKLYVKRMRFFKDPWNVFDFVIVGMAWLPASGPLSVLRALRILRALRLISNMPQLRKVVTGLLGSLPGLMAVSAILILLFYIGSVISTKLFGEAFPQWFGNIGLSAYSLFQIMTLESWSMGIVRPVMRQFPYAWAFFVPFILVTTFTTLNLLIAVLVNAMQAETDAAAEERARVGHDERVQLIREVSLLRKAVESLQERMK